MEKTKIFNWISIVLMGVLLLLQFLPFWNIDGVSVSIQGYIWLKPGDEQIGEYLAPYLNVGDSFLINKVIAMPLLVLVLVLTGIVLNLIFNNIYTTVLPLLCGVIGAWGYLAKPAFQLGTGWVLHLVVCIAIFVVAGIKMYFLIKED